jgi:hypothetical protein
MAAGGTTPQITLATTGAVTLTGALNGTSASFSGAISTDQTDGGTIFLKTAGSNVGLLTSTFQILGSGSKVDLNAFVYGANDFGIWTNSTKRLTISSTGAAFSSNVTAAGIITANGGDIDGALGEAILFGNATFAAAQKNRIRSSISASTNGNILAIETNNGTIGSYNNNQLVLKGDGNVGIGTASPTRRLHAEGSPSVGQEIARFVNNANNSVSDFAMVTILGANANNSSSYHYIAASGASDVLYILGNGNVANANNSYGAISDAKLKENITDATPKLEDLLKVKVRNYNLIGEENKQIGVIAQELEEVFPAMIDESEDFEEVEVPQLDEEGNEVLNEEGEVVTTKQRVSKGTTTKSVKYSVFVPMLIKAIQEQQEQIDSLKNQIK